MLKRILAAVALTLGLLGGSVVAVQAATAAPAAAARRTCEYQTANSLNYRTDDGNYWQSEMLNVAKGSPCNDWNLSKSRNLNTGRSQCGQYRIRLQGFNASTDWQTVCRRWRVPMQNAPEGLGYWIESRYFPSQVWIKT